MNWVELPSKKVLREISFELWKSVPSYYWPSLFYKVFFFFCGLRLFPWQGLASTTILCFQVHLFPLSLLHGLNFLFLLVYCVASPALSPIFCKVCRWRGFGEHSLPDFHEVLNNFSFVMHQSWPLFLTWVLFSFSVAFFTLLWKKNLF